MTGSEFIPTDYSEQIMGDWRSRAACKSEDPELFFPVGENRATRPQIEQAKEVCRRCHVSAQCLEWALEKGIDDGIWGGLTENERRALKRRNDRIHRNPDAA